jgi:predicted DNA-binding transcriptional regulator AlpA
MQHLAEANPMSESPTLRSAASVREQLDCSAVTIWRRIKNRDLQFPRPLKISGRLYFRADEIDRWIEVQSSDGNDRQDEEA